MKGSSTVWLIVLAVVVWWLFFRNPSASTTATVSGSGTVPSSPNNPVSYTTNPSAGQSVVYGLTAWQGPTTWPAPAQGGSVRPVGPSFGLVGRLLGGGTL